MVIDVLTYSSYNFKEQLKKSKATLSQLQVDEMVFEFNATETSNGSAFEDFSVKDRDLDYLIVGTEMLMPGSCSCRDVKPEKRGCRKRNVRKFN